MIYRKLFAAILAGVMVMSMAACGGSETSTTGSTETAQTEETKTEETTEEEPAEETSELSGSVSTNGSTSMEKVIGILSEQFIHMIQPVPVQVLRQLPTVPQTLVFLPEH